MDDLQLRLLDLQVTGLERLERQHTHLMLFRMAKSRCDAIMSPVWPPNHPNGVAVFYEWAARLRAENKMKRRGIPSPRESTPHDAAIAVQVRLPGMPAGFEEFCRNRPRVRFALMEQRDFYSYEREELCNILAYLVKATSFCTAVPSSGPYDHLSPSDRQLLAADLLEKLKTLRDHAAVIVKGSGERTA